MSYMRCSTVYNSLARLSSGLPFIVLLLSQFMTIQSRAAELRQSDNGWGWSIAAMIPVAGVLTTIYHGATRRTWKPILWCCGVPLAVGAAIGVTSPALADNDDFMNALNVANIVAVPFLFKKGQDDARKAIA